MRSLSRHKAPNSIRQRCRDIGRCLCPNHHVQIDKGALSIDDEHRLVGLRGSLTVHGDHAIDTEYLAYHMEHIYVPPDGA